jgi:thiol:disulfide interchange protein DsbC
MSAVRKILVLTLAILAPAVPAFAMSGEGCGGDCASCHSITVDEANGLLKEIGKVTAVKPAAVRGLYEITLERGGQTAIGYLDYGKKHLMGGQIFDLAARQVVGAPPVKPPAEHLDPATLETRDSLVLGNPKGKKHLFVFTDPECPYCAKLHAELQKLVGMEPDLAIYIKLLPLTKIHPHSYDKARVILGENSLKLLEHSFANQPLPAPGKKDRKEPIDNIMEYAEKVGIVATPTLVLADGRILPGFKEAPAIKELLK